MTKTHGWPNKSGDAEFAVPNGSVFDNGKAAYLRLPKLRLTFEWVDGDPRLRAVEDLIKSYK